MHRFDAWNLKLTKERKVLSCIRKVNEFPLRLIAYKDGKRKMWKFLPIFIPISEWNVEMDSSRKIWLQPVFRWFPELSMNIKKFLSFNIPFMFLFRWTLRKYLLTDHPWMLMRHLLVDAVSILPVAQSFSIWIWRLKKFMNWVRNFKKKLNFPVQALIEPEVELVKCKIGQMEMLKLLKITNSVARNATWHYIYMLISLTHMNYFRLFQLANN